MNDDTFRFALLRRDPETAEAVQKVMGLPDDRWSGIEITFGTEEIGEAKVTFILTPEQLASLALIAGQLHSAERP